MLGITVAHLELMKILILQYIMTNINLLVPCKCTEDGEIGQG